MKIAVIGTGYVGLVTGTCLAEVGHEVICVDIDEAKVAKLKQGITPIYEPGLPELVKKNYDEGRLTFTADFKEIGSPAAVFFALPTPPGGDGEADLSFVLKAATDIASYIKDYTVIINKSTVPVGTSKKVTDVMKEQTDVPFDVVSNPEFLREGLAISDFMQADRIVVGTSSDKAREVMEEIYRPFTTEGVPLFLMNEASSEMTKYAANSFLATKISFMNEVANLCELTGANIDMVREGIGADERIGKRFLYAGIGYGGSCFPKDVLALQRAARANNYDFKLLTAVIDVNDRQKKIIVQKITKQFGEDLSGKTFALWGLAFKPDTDDIREAPAHEIIRELLSRGAAVRAYDPEAVENTKRVFPTEVTYAGKASEALEGVDALIVATEWKEFIAFEPHVLAEEFNIKYVFDGRNIYDPEAMAAAGITYVSMGRG